MASRAALWAEGHDECVEVNQRALIDKVLARYSGKFTVFRELLQNSDDAQSRSVEIRFESKSYIDRNQLAPPPSTSADTPLGILKEIQVHQWTFKNNGIVFRDEDWTRLKKIAEGNPDEEKIGAFGVGFYSLFSVTEEPFVSSGDECMLFYWKDGKDQLFVRRHKTEEHSEWTSFEMQLREPMPIPNAFDFTRFLASSLTFMTYLSEVSVFLDGRRLTHLTKSVGISKPIAPPSYIQLHTDTKMMKIRNLRSTAVNIRAEVIQWVYSSGTEQIPPPAAVAPIRKPTSGGFFSFAKMFLASTTPVPEPTPLPIEPVDMLASNASSVSLSIISAEVETNIDRKLSSELLRSTKKHPPKLMKYELIYTGKDEYDASKKEDEKQPASTGSIWKGLRADLDGAGDARIFIGHATAQTTGIGGHMAARFMPTVERESIDLIDRNVAVWNNELLVIGGIVARATYEIEMSNIKSLWDGASSAISLPDQELQDWLRKRFIHALKFFTFHKSTPDERVSGKLEETFFRCAGNRFSLLTSVGVRNSSEIRHLADPVVTTFLKQLPVIAGDVMEQGKPMFNSLRSKGFIKDLGFDDIVYQLSLGPLSEDEMAECLKWWVSKKTEIEGSLAQQQYVQKNFLDIALFIVGKPGSGTEEIIPLNSILCFPSNSRKCSVILEGPLPKTLLPLSIAGKFKPSILSANFPWKEFTTAHWVEHLSKASGPTPPEYDMTMSAPWAERVLITISKAWPALLPDDKRNIIIALNGRTFVPTSGGLKKPKDAYFPSAHLFPDLPVVTFASGASIKGAMEKLLEDMGVRKHVELQVIFDRMIKTREWSIPQLVKYLTSVQKDLTSEELQRLRLTAVFPQEMQSSDKPVKYRADQLYEPLDVFRELGLPVLDYNKERYRSSSEEAKFLCNILGLLRYPPLPQVVNLCASPNFKIRAAALKYLQDNLQAKYPDFNPASFSSVEFIPALRNGEACLGSYDHVFSNSEWAAFGFLVTPSNVTLEMATKLKVRQHPPFTQIISRLQQHAAKDVSEARLWFEILAKNIGHFDADQLQTLSHVAMVPVPQPSSNQNKPETYKISCKYLPPRQCFLGDITSEEAFHSKIFVFVDFGSLGNNFLAACGARRKPSVEEVASVLVESPHKFYELAGGPKDFINELRNLAVNRAQITRPTINKLKTSPVLLASQPKETKTEKGDVDDEEWNLQYDLKKANEIVIVDDPKLHLLFGDKLFVAPQEDILESFYRDLGSPRLSTLVEEHIRPIGPVPGLKASADLRALILQRLPLLLHDHTHAQIKFKHSWLSTEDNLTVSAFKSLEITQSLHWGKVHSITYDATATANFSNKRINIWITANSQIDMYEVASSLTRIIFESAKSNDTLLFMTILSTDLKTLKRRGYNVDRILGQQREQRKMEREREQARLLSQPPPPPPPPVPEKATSMLTSSSSSTLPALPELPSNTPKSTLRPVSSVIQNFKRKIGNNNTLQEMIASASTPPPIPQQSRPMPQNPRQKGATPLSDIDANVDMAINACRPESGNLLRNREQMSMVKESLNEGYCDISGRVGDLEHIGNINTVKVYLTREVPNSKGFLDTKRETITRFVHVMIALAKVYKLPLSNMHIFCDVDGDLIAFNRNGSIFLNLRFYEAWHDTEVMGGNFTGAYISWYLTVAHEVAHNLISNHGAEHEFYFSAICEKHIMELGKLLHS